MNVEQIRKRRKAMGLRSTEPTITELRSERDSAERTIARLNALPGNWNASEERAMADALRNCAELTEAIRYRLTERERERRNHPVRAQATSGTGMRL